MIQTSGSNTHETPAKRNSRKVNGGANGKPNLATTKPVLQSKTKKPGMVASQGLGPGVGLIGRALRVDSVAGCIVMSNKAVQTMRRHALIG